MMSCEEKIGLDRISSDEKRGLIILGSIFIIIHFEASRATTRNRFHALGSGDKTTNEKLERNNLSLLVK